MIGLGAHTLKNDLSERYMGIAESLTSTCHEAYDRTATKLGPEAFRFTEAIEAKALKSNEKYYILRPEVIESYLVQHILYLYVCVACRVTLKMLDVK